MMTKVPAASRHRFDGLVPRPPSQLLSLNEELMHDYVLPRLPLLTLARFALSSPDMAAIVARYIVRPERWADSGRAIADALMATNDQATLMAVLKGVVSDHLDVDDKALTTFSASAPEEFGRRDTYVLIESCGFGSVYTLHENADWPGQYEAARAAFRLVGPLESRQLGLLLRALAVRMSPPQLVDLIKSLALTALGSPWPHAYHIQTHRYGTDRQQRRCHRLVINTLASFSYTYPYMYPPPRPLLRLTEFNVPPASRQPWTTALLSELCRSLRGGGADVGALYNELGEGAPPDTSFLFDDEHLHSFVDLYTDGMEDRAKAEFMVPFFCFEERLDEYCVPRLTTFATQAGHECSLSLARALIMTLDKEILPAVREELENAGHGRLEHSEYFCEGLHELPASFLSGWAAAVDFPRAFDLSDVELLLETMSRCDEHVVMHFSALRLRWIEQLAASAEGLAKIAAISRSSAAE